MIPAFLALLLASSAWAGPAAAVRGAAKAAPVVPGPIVAGVESDAVEAAYAAWAATRGAKGADAQLACRPFAPSAVLCFRWLDGEIARWLTRARAPDLAVVEVAAAARGAAAAERLAPNTVEGFRARWWLASGAGDEHAALLTPAAITAKIGSADWVAGTPARGVLVVWVPGDPEFDKVVAVGVRRLYDAAGDEAVSPTIWRWTGLEWESWGRARVVE